jgi:uncharacterized protein YaiI (UPF0178 family)
MRIFVDADSCPRLARELILKTAKRLSIEAIFVANRPIPGLYKPSRMELCLPACGAADDRIVSLARTGDLAICRDIPLASRLVQAGVRVIDDRGRVYNYENINQLLSLRNFTVSLSNTGLPIERSASYGKRELKSFANSLDKSTR